jgi:hypothetical protein
MQQVFRYLLGIHIVPTYPHKFAGIVPIEGLRRCGVPTFAAIHELSLVHIVRGLFYIKTTKLRNTAWGKQIIVLRDFEASLATPP